MKKLNCKTILLALFIIFLVVGCETILPTTEDANSRLHSRIVLQYTSYVKADKTLTEAQKNQDITAVKSYDYNMLCKVVIPRYIQYIKTDPHITDEDIRAALIQNAESYIYLNRHFNERRH